MVKLQYIIIHHSISSFLDEIQFEDTGWYLHQKYDRIVLSKHKDILDDMQLAYTEINQGSTSKHLLLNLSQNTQNPYWL